MTRKLKQNKQHPRAIVLGLTAKNDEPQQTRQIFVIFGQVVCPQVAAALAN